MGGHVQADESYIYEPWYKYGIYFLFFEAAIAVGVSIYSISMAFTGHAVQFKVKKVHQKPAAVETTMPARSVPPECAGLPQEKLEECLKQAGIRK